MKSLTLEAFANESLVENPLEELGFGEDLGRDRIWAMTDEVYENATRLEANK